MGRPAGTHVTAEGSGHYVQHDRPDLVIDTILDVIDEVRNCATAVHA